ncbi:phage portal protein, partial [Marinagarivorans algicola]|uniref:phage portal protein n=1 Tax=Marinagarivorans algicola TaxID=1513270 RepID=UPI0006B44D47
MNILEKSIAAISPRWALSRMHNKFSIKAYEAVKSGRLNSAKQQHGSADTRSQFGSRSLRGQARYYQENSDLVDGLLTSMVNNVVGRDGIGVEPMPLDRNGNVHEAFAKALLDGFSEWSLKPDTRGELTRPELERQVCMTWLRDGECLGEHVLGRVAGFTHPNKVVPFSLQAMEPDFLPFDFHSKSGAISQGIERNQWGQAQAFHVYEYHPGGDHFKSLKTRRVAADRMQHIKLVKRLNQARGVSILASCMGRLSGLQNYEESELVAARIAAAMAFYIKKGMPDDFEEGGGEKRRSFPISPGTIFDDLKPGEDVGTIESKRPSALLQPFRDSMVRMICSAVGANFSSVSKQYDGTYSSQRQELVESYVSYGVLTNTFIAQWSRPVYRRYVQMAMMTGAIKVPADVDTRTVLLAYYQPPVMPWIDPKKEAEGFERIVAGGFGTEAEVVRGRGK